MVAGFEAFATDRALRSWLARGEVDKSVGDGLTFVASAASAKLGKASWILRYRHAGRYREKVLGRYPDLSLKAAREAARKDRALLQQGLDPVAQARQERSLALESKNVEELGELWVQRHIEGRHKHPEVVKRVLRRHVNPAIGKLPIAEVRPIHVDEVLRRIVQAGAPTAVNDALRYMTRMLPDQPRQPGEQPHWLCIRVVPCWASAQARVASDRQEA